MASQKNGRHGKNSVSFQKLIGFIFIKRNLARGAFRSHKRTFNFFQ